MGVVGNKSRTGMVNSPEMRKHISEALKGTRCGLGNKSRTGQKRSREEIEKGIATRIANGGFHHTEETKRKIAESHKGLKPCIGLKNALGYRHTEEAKQAMSVTRKGRKVSDYVRYKISRGNLGKHRSEPTKQTLRVYWAAHKEEQREIGMKAWSDPGKVKIMVSNMRLARQASPNKVESRILDLLNKYFPNEWEYVGNGKLVIDKKCPDFVRNHGNNQLIELFGDYWHKGENPQDRIDLFKKHGYDTLIIWQSDIKRLHEDGLASRISEFMGIVTSKE
jgi:hypothetical protein